MGFEHAIKAFIEAVDDLATLEITTYTGTLAQAVDAETGDIDWSRFTPTSSELLLVAATRVDADMDTVNFRANHEGIDDLEGLYELHQAAVESAQAGRAALLQMFQGMLGTL